MKLDLITFFSLALLTISVSADSQLVKRADKLPYDSLTSTTCKVPEVCSNIQAPRNCRCNNVWTMCINNERRFCWGSETLTKTVQPPQECNGQYSGTPTCLSDGTQVLCVTQNNQYCYGKYQQGGSFAIEPIPTQSTPSSTPATTGNSPTSNPSSTNASGTPTPTSAAFTEQPQWTLLLALLFIAVQSL
ncbi:hypothetical protein EC973_006516 [Apophysomyces ossiformis]|uniref:Uncharacterized protein n=1 Tax=Apophysomyces ossiformis TaxID=679940 RepID=A0A8H7BYS6_9FUNG|nr:hypothetical protein EC973_006516 [Apophysomyces ossiformis]